MKLLKFSSDDQVCDYKMVYPETQQEINEV